jgi:hypothetical protein
MWLLHQAVHWVGLAVLCVAAVFCLGTGLYTAAGEVLQPLPGSPTPQIASPRNMCSH